MKHHTSYKHSKEVVLLFFWSNESRRWHGGRYRLELHSVHQTTCTTNNAARTSKNYFAKSSQKQLKLCFSHANEIKKWQLPSNKTHLDGWKVSLPSMLYSVSYSINHFCEKSGVRIQRQTLKQHMHFYSFERQSGFWHSKS